MKIVFLCRQDSDNITDTKIVREYTSKKDAKNDIEDYLLSYISDELGEGKNQALIANQSDKTVEEILSNDTYPLNHYIRLENGLYCLYRKYKEEKEVSEGWLYTTTKKVYTPLIKKVYTYILVTHNIELYNYIPRCNCNEIIKDSTTKSAIKSNANQPYIDELKNIFENSTPNPNFTGVVKISGLNYGETGMKRYNASSFKKNTSIDTIIG